MKSSILMDCVKINSQMMLKNLYIGCIFHFSYFLTNIGSLLVELFLIIRFPLEFLPVPGPLTWWCASTLSTALLCSSRAGAWYCKQHNYHRTPYYLNSDKVFLLLSDQYHNPERGFKPGPLSECLLEFDTRSKLLSHHAGSQACLFIKKVLYFCSVSNRNLTIKIQYHANSLLIMTLHL